jgi:hypothetical protein
MDLGAWRRRLSLAPYEQAFRAHDIDADVLPDLTADDLIGLGVTSIGHRRKLLGAIAALRAGPASPGATALPARARRGHGRGPFRRAARGRPRPAGRGSARHPERRALPAFGAGPAAEKGADLHCESAEAQLGTLPPSAERSRTDLEVQLAKGIAIRTGKGYSAPETERAFLRACELCEELDDRVRLVHALRSLWGCCYVAGRWGRAAEAGDRLELAMQGLEDRTAICMHWYVQGATRLFHGELVEAVEVERRQDARSFELRASMALARLWAARGELANAHALLAPVCGSLAEGVATPDLREAKALADELAGPSRARAAQPPRA